MDGRIQLPVINFLQKRFNAVNVDNITEAGPDRVLFEKKENNKIESLLKKIDTSFKMHNSNKIAVVAHPDCAGNPVSKEEHIIHLKKSVEFLSELYPDSEIIALWVKDNKEVEEIELTSL